DENIQISCKVYQNPLAGVACWGETYMGETIASVLNVYEDPRISIYYNPSTLADHTEEYLGVPQGVYDKDG
ncbi:SusD/RagB family nutrient-binding outer membrane lipoprotein, partial [Phocaeicola vulgatus]|uniref:SusD/RagB family nutrient-binding outer membrane lipoprotein n=1 Tax=Phocaeicola vulgatus TaxID=821 RepID=UPI00210B683A